MGANMNKQLTEKDPSCLSLKEGEPFKEELVPEPGL